MSLRSEFPIFEHSRYLNTCSLGTLARRSRARIDAYLDTWEARGAAAWYDDWWAALAELRRRYGQWIGAPGETVALHPNISSAIGVVAGALDYSTRPKVVVTDLDFPTVAYQWLAREAGGVEVEVVTSEDSVTIPLEKLMDAIDDRTALVATSHVFFSTGAILDVGAVARHAHARGALVLIDGYQAVGQIPVDVAASGVDFYVGGGLKWLLGGPGIAFLYVSPEHHASLVPSVTGWFAHRDQFAFDPLTLEFHDDARRFETGTPAMASVFCQLGGLDVLDEVGPDRVRAITRDLTRDLVAEARVTGLEPRLTTDPDDHSAIVVIPRTDPAADVARLGREGIVIDARPGHVRISPYFYNVRDDHRAAIEALTSD